MMRCMHLGIADHLGWAIAVTASADHEVLDRRRIVLVEPGLTEAPIHYQRERDRLSDEATTALIATVRASIARTASAAFDELEAGLPAPIASVSLRAVPSDFPRDIATQRRAPYESRADAIMYREVLVEVARRRGWDVDFYVARDVESEAAAVLGERADAVLNGPRARLGAPWGKEQRIALAAAVLTAAALTPVAADGDGR
jgi:hypothetical protein